MKPFAAFSVVCVICALASCMNVDSGRTAEKTANRTADHPLAGFWKKDGCADNFGLAIAPAGDKLYSVSFCGPNGCFTPGTYRPNTTIVGDSSYKVADENNIEVRGSSGFSKYNRCAHR